eukprot:11017694-Heterocapsa_arctica.AAC.1
MAVRPYMGLCWSSWVAATWGPVVLGELSEVNAAAFAAAATVRVSAVAAAMETGPYMTGGAGC